MEALHKFPRAFPWCPLGEIRVLAFPSKISKLVPETLIVQLCNYMLFLFCSQDLVIDICCCGSSSF